MPGSNLTNLIVLGHLRQTGSQFLARMWLPALAALSVTALVVAVCERTSLRAPQPPSPGSDTRPGDAQAGPAWPAGARPGLAAVLVAMVLVVALRSPAIPVAITGAIAAAIRVARDRAELSRGSRGARDPRPGRPFRVGGPPPVRPAGRGGLGGGMCRIAVS